MKKWLVAYTMSRSEHKTAERLAKRGVEVFCPMQTTVRQWSDRKKKVKSPIFSSYLFLHLEDNEFDLVLQDPGIVRFVYWLGKPAIVRDSDMDKLMDFIEVNQNGTFESNFTEGAEVVISTGPFKDQTGVILKKVNGNPLILIENLGLKLVANTTEFEII